MSLVIRNADADQLVRLGDVLDALHTFHLEILQSLSDATLLDSSDWQDVQSVVQDEVQNGVDYFVQTLLPELGV